MKIKALFFSSLLISSPIFAAVPIQGWYASVFGGAAYVPGNVNTLASNGLSYSNSKYNTGFDAGGSLGYKSNNLRYEIEGTYIDAKPDEFDVNGVRQTNVGGHSSAFAGMVNIYVDFDGIIVPEIQPYLGVGIGYAHIDNELTNTRPTFSSTYKNTNTVFAYQGKVGLTYNFVENYAAYVGYRYLGTDNARNWGKRFQAHLGNIGVTYRFDGAQYK